MRSSSSITISSSSPTARTCRTDLPEAVGTRMSRVFPSASPRQPVGRSPAERSRRRSAAASCADGRDRQPRPRHRLGRRRPRPGPDGRARAARGCSSASAAPTTGSTSRRRASSCPATASISRGPRRADAIDDGELDPELFRPGALDVLAQHILAMAVAAPFQQDELLEQFRSAAPYAGLTQGPSRRSSTSSRLAIRAESLRPFSPLVPERAACGASPGRRLRSSTINAGVIVEQPLMSVRFRNGRKLGTVEEGFASALAPGDRFFFAGLSLEVEQFKDTDIIVRASSKSGQIVTYGGQRMSTSTDLCDLFSPHARRPQRLGTASPTMSANGWRYSRSARCCPSPTSSSSRPSRMKASIS